MSNSSLVNYTQISPNKSVPRNNKITHIVIHHMSGNLSVETCGEVFQPTSRQASSNYGVGSDGRVGMYVEEKDRSWCTGNREIDNKAITIETANDSGAPEWHVSDKALAKLIDLCVDICKRNGIAKLNYTGDKTGNLHMHKWYQNTDCPGPYLSSKFTYIANSVNSRLGVAPTPVPTYSQTQFIKDVQKACGASVDGIAGPETLSKTVTVSKYTNYKHPVVVPLQKYLNAQGYDCGTVDGWAGTLFDGAVKKYQKANGCYVDGEITKGCKTWKKLLGLA